MMREKKTNSNTRVIHLIGMKAIIKWFLLSVLWWSANNTVIAQDYWQQTNGLYSWESQTIATNSNDYIPASSNSGEMFRPLESAISAPDLVIFSIPRDLQGNPQDTVQVPLNINPSNHLVGSFDATVEFKNNLLTYAGFVAGSILPTSLGWTIDVNPNSAIGTVTIGALDLVGETNGLTGSGTTVWLKFLVNSAAAGGDTSHFRLSGLAATDTNAVPLPVDGSGGRFTIKPFISGYVRDASGLGIGGAMLSGLPGNPTTNPTGYYIARVDYGWSGIVRPSKTGYRFKPDSLAYSHIKIDHVNQDYTGTKVDAVFFWIPSNLQGSPSDTVQIPLNIDPRGHHIGSFDVTVGFENTLLSYAGFTIGPILPSSDGWMVDVNGNNPQGKVNIGAFNATNALIDSGTAVFLKFVVNTSAVAGDTNNIALSGLAATDTNAFSLPVNGVGGIFTVKLDPPTAPTNLTASAVNSKQINLAWQDNATDETGYKIERKTGATGMWTLIDSVGANASSYVNTGLIGGTQYHYRVYAHNSAGNSGYSNEANATTISEPPADISVVPTSWDYGEVPVGNSSDKVFEIKNDGSALLQVSNISIGGASDFEIVNGGISFSLSPGAIHQLTVQFKPSSEGTKKATLLINSNDPDESLFEVSLSGTGEQQHTGTYAFPNPFDPETEPIQIRFPISMQGSVTIKIMDGVGNLVQEMNSSATQSFGFQQVVQWDGRNGRGDLVVNGLYFYVIETSTKERLIGKIAVLR